jgi:predicted ATPase
MMQFDRIRLSNWRNFKEVDVALESRMFLVGPNASGKSSLLDVFRFLRDISKPGGGLQKAVEDRGGVSSIRCLAATQYSNIAVEVEVDGWHYKIEFNQDNKQRRPTLKREEVQKEGKSILSRPDEYDERDPERLRQTHLEQVNMNQDFRELGRFIREPERFMGRREDPFGGDFLERLASTDKRTRGARLRKMQRALQIVAPQLSELTVDWDRMGKPHLKVKYEHWRDKGAWQDENLLSDGTLRFLGFLWSLLEGDGPLLLEEPELSLHPAIIRRLASLIYRIQKGKRRQVLVSTHSYDLTVDDGIGGEEVLILTPTNDGTKVMVGKDDRTIWALLKEGMSVAEAVMPATEPKDAYQLELFR